MARLGHLELIRINLERPRRLRPGFGVRLPPADVRQHGLSIQEGVDRAVAQRNAARVRFPGVDPSRVLVFELSGQIEDDVWVSNGVTVVEKEASQVVGVFPDDGAMGRFLERLEAFTAARRTRRPGQVYPDNYSFFAAIAAAHPPTVDDRLGARLRAAMPSEEEIRAFDVELWHRGTREECATVRRSLEGWLASDGVEGRVADGFIGDSLFLLRIVARRRVADALLQLPDVRRVDLPPSPDFPHSNIVRSSADDFPEIRQPRKDAPGVAVIDSGVRQGHPFIAPALGEATSFLTANADSDDVVEAGHGTKVVGLALYGDVAECAVGGGFAPEFWVYSGRVLNSENQFDDERLIVEQMRESITYFSQTYGCRVFNLSLGMRSVSSQRKPTPWAWILDFLARELDVIILVAAGNYRFVPDGSAEEIVTAYPDYLLTDEARIDEPGTASIAITVGSLNERDSVRQGARADGDPAVRLIGRSREPSPFTRSGPGLGGAIKPDVCDFGGGWFYDGRFGRLMPPDGWVGVLSLNRNFAGSSLFSFDSGTSYAVPRVAHIAASLHREYRDAPANLLRGLLANSARHTAEAKDLLGAASDKLYRLCGYGQPSMDRALYSDDHRVTLYAVGEIPLDTFHLYRVPIPGEFRERRGERRIVVTLAFDPPTRHTRSDYLGCSMSFRLLRGYSVDQVRRAFEPRDGVEDPLDALQEIDRRDVGPRQREGGTLQQATYTFRRTIDSAHGEEYLLLVRCEDQWLNKERNPEFRQRYALVVTLEHDDLQARLYGQVRARARTERLRVRRGR
jgi:subtilase family protein